MKYMISCRQTIEYLRKNATEIKVDYKDKARLTDFLAEGEWITDIDIDIIIPREIKDFDFDFFDRYNEVFNLVFSAEDTELLKVLKGHGYKIYWAYPVSSFWELRSLLRLGVDEVLIEAPLFFDLAKVKQLCGKKVDIRVNAICADNPRLSHENGICGPFIRPEDVNTYKKYVQHIEFGEQDLAAERALVRVYTSRIWPGNLNLLLQNFNYNVDNRGIPSTFAQTRLHCGQRCQKDNSCHYCFSELSLLNYIDQHKEEIKQTYNISTEDK